MREEVEPSLRSSLHAEADIEKASISILRGSVLLQGIRIGNPQGFSGPDCLRVKKCEIKIGLLPIMKGRMDELSAIIVQDAELNLQRNAEGGINAIHLLAARVAERRLFQKPGYRAIS